MSENLVFAFSGQQRQEIVCAVNRDILVDRRNRIFRPFAIAVLAAGFITLEANAQSAPNLPSTTAPSAPMHNGISISAQISVVFQPDGFNKIGAMTTNFADGVAGEKATNDYVFSMLQQAAMSGLAEATGRGAQSGHADVVAVVYRFSADADTVSAWAPIGVFINTTDMNLDVSGRAAFHTRVQFIPDQTASQVRTAMPLDPPTG